MMKKVFLVLTGLLVSMALVSTAGATNGDLLIGIGPISRAMGGVGVASPQDAISAVFANPAAMCFGPYCPASEMNFAGTAFAPEINAKVTNPQGTFKADADDKIYPIPAFGFSIPIGSGPSNWRFGLSAYGVSGLGVDYRDTKLDQPNFFQLPPPPQGPGGTAPLITGEFTDLQIMKFAPAVSVQLGPQFSLGAALHINYATLDLRDGTSEGYVLGVQPGIIYKPIPQLSFGLTYISPQEVTFDNVTDFDQDGSADNLDLEAPQQVALGVAYDFIGLDLLVETNVKWINWADARGYEDFDWDDQWVFAVGTQWKPIDKLSLRLGYNYGQNPVDDNDGFNGLRPKKLQGKTIPSEYYFETFRVIGFPAIVEHHLTGGIGYQFTDSFLLELGAVYAFENDHEQSGTNLFGQPTTIESELKQFSLDFGLTWRF